MIDFRRNDKDGINGKGRSHRVRPQPHSKHRTPALTQTVTKRYIIAPNKGLVQGSTSVESGAGADIKPGNNLPLRNIPTGTTIHACGTEVPAAEPRWLVPQAPVGPVSSAKEGSYAHAAYAFR